MCVQRQFVFLLLLVGLSGKQCLTRKSVVQVQLYQMMKDVPDVGFVLIRANTKFVLLQTSLNETILDVSPQRVRALRYANCTRHELLQFLVWTLAIHQANCYATGNGTRASAFSRNSGLLGEPCQFWGQAMIDVRSKVQDDRLALTTVRHKFDYNSAGQNGTKTVSKWELGSKDRTLTHNLVLAACK